MMVQTASSMPGFGLVARSDPAAEKQIPAKAMIVMRIAAWSTRPANFLKYPMPDGLVSRA